MTTFDERLAVATRWETVALEALRRNSWDAEPFGQGQLPKRMRDHLRDFPTAVRWMPDIIAARFYPTGLHVVRYVDVKAGEAWRRTGNHSVEVAAMNAAERWQDFAGNPVYYLFSDGYVITAEDAREVCSERPWMGSGSGTPFVVFPREACRPFRDVFGDQPTTA